MNKTVMTTLMAVCLWASCDRQQQVKANGNDHNDNTLTVVEKPKGGYAITMANAGDSAYIVGLLKEGSHLDGKTNVTIFYARKFLGRPYVAYTLDQDKEEKLVINTKGVDCTTFLENVVALTICTKRKISSFHGFCEVLRQVRYIGGKVGYTTRQHYFTTWLTDNIRERLVTNVELPGKPLSEKRKAHVNYMTTHVESYKMLNAHRQWLPAIREMEKQVNATEFTFIPKQQLSNSNRYRDYIKDGDIIGIVTNKNGLDISHVGFAVWHKDGLHLLNASSIHKKVVDEPMTLYQYLQKQTSSAGIRVARIL